MLHRKLLQHRCSTHYQTCCMGGPSLRSDLYIRKMQKVKMQKMKTEKKCFALKCFAVAQVLLLVKKSSIKTSSCFCSFYNVLTSSFTGL